jgi:hypothetical protein
VDLEFQHDRRHDPVRIRRVGNLLRLERPGEAGDWLTIPG